jgi:AcrR family transcriptional regulator
MATRGRTSERRDALVRIAAELFAEQGYRATTVRHIGDAAGVLSGSLYHHFDSKETILDELLSSYLEELLDTYRTIVKADDDPATTLRELVRASFRSLSEHRAAITVLRDGTKSGDFRSDLDPVVTYRFLRDSVWVAVRWFRPDGPLSADGLADHYLTLVLDGLKAA